jgi:beta-glucosidase/6-phospho-beta-glucosidase/beta-galactosidase
MRWGVPWYRVNPAPGEFDWSWTDQVLPYMVGELGVTPIIDLMHYGCPFWLEREFDNVAYPRAVATYARAFAERYASLIRWYTPVNEPTVNAQWCGLLGRWPPYLRGERGYVRLALQLADGILQTVEALRSARSDAVMVHVEAVGLTRSSEPDLDGVARDSQLRRFLILDLITGRVSPDHPLFTWMVFHGAVPATLRSLGKRAINLDVLGLNFYPQWSTDSLRVTRRGRLVSRPVERDGSAFAEMAQTYHQRYGVPMLVTETSARGADEVRSAWLESSLADIKRMRANGIPLLGYTWFPLFTMVDWAYRFGVRPKETYYHELGLYRLDNESSRGRWRPTALVEPFRDAILHPHETIGDLRSGVCLAR